MMTCGYVGGSHAGRSRVSYSICHRGRERAHEDADGHADPGHGRERAPAVDEHPGREEDGGEACSEQPSLWTLGGVVFAADRQRRFSSSAMVEKRVLDARI